VRGIPKWKSGEVQRLFVERKGGKGKKPLGVKANEILGRRWASYPRNKEEKSGKLRSGGFLRGGHFKELQREVINSCGRGGGDNL